MISGNKKYLCTKKQPFSGVSGVFKQFYYFVLNAGYATSSLLSKRPNTDRSSKLH